MTVQELTNKVKAAEEKVAKCEATIERHKAQKQKKIDKFNKLGYGDYYAMDDDTARDMRENGTMSWEDYWLLVDIEHKDDDIKGATEKLEDAKKVLKNWQEKLGREEAKQQYIADSIPQIIKDFLNEWKEGTIKYYNEMVDRYYRAQETFKRDYNYLIFDYITEHLDKYNYIRNDPAVKEFDPNADYYHICYDAWCKVRRTDDYRQLEELYVNPYKNDPTFAHWKYEHFDEAWLDKVITQEMNNKLIDLMARVTKVTGTITDAAGLRIRNGELNGVIEGERGTASVTTIGAGGWNIQRFHWRTLVHPIK